MSQSNLNAFLTYTVFLGSYPMKSQELISSIHIIYDSTCSGEVESLFSLFRARALNFHSMCAREYVDCAIHTIICSTLCYGAYSAVGKGADCRAHHYQVLGSHFPPYQPSFPSAISELVPGFLESLNCLPPQVIVLPNTHSNHPHDIPNV